MQKAMPSSFHACYRPCNLLASGVPLVFGCVSHWQVEADELDGIEGMFGEALRPVPIDLFEGDTSHPIVDAAWQPAYWNPNHRTACYAPV